MGLRFTDLRAKRVTEAVTNPRKKARHEKQNLKELIKRSEEDYVDFQSISELVPMQEYCEKYVKTKKPSRTTRNASSTSQRL